MPSSVIQTPHVALSNYRKKLTQAANELEITVREVTQIAEKLGEGGLVGRAGAAMNSALLEKLNPAINALRNKTLEEESDIRKHQGEGVENVERKSVQELQSKG